MKFERKLVYGFGINDSEKPTQYMVNGKRIKCPIYVMWSNMYKRCYSESYLKTHKSYVGCYVSDEWKYFTRFREWVIQQDWEGKNLDKDILKADNKEYGPDACVFVPSYVNTALGIRKLYNNGLPVGVSVDTASGKYVSGISINGKRKSLGYFECRTNAHKAWQIAKAAQIEAIALRYSEEKTYNPKVLEALTLKVLALRQDLKENRETVTL